MLDPSSSQLQQTGCPQAEQLCSSIKLQGSGWFECGAHFTVTELLWKRLSVNEKNSTVCFPRPLQEGQDKVLFKNNSLLFPESWKQAHELKNKLWQCRSLCPFRNGKHYVLQSILSLILKYSWDIISVAIGSVFRLHTVHDALGAVVLEPQTNVSKWFWPFGYAHSQGRNFCLSSSLGQLWYSSSFQWGNFFLNQTAKTVFE